MEFKFPTELIVWRKSDPDDCVSATLTESADAKGYKLQFRSYFKPIDALEEHALYYPVLGWEDDRRLPPKYVHPSDLVGSDNNQYYHFPSPTIADPGPIRESRVRRFPAPTFAFTHFTTSSTTDDVHLDGIDEIRVAFPDDLVNRSAHLLLRPPFRPEKGTWSDWPLRFETAEFTGEYLDACLRHHFSPSTQLLEHHAKWQIDVLLSPHTPLDLEGANHLLFCFQTLVSMTNHRQIPFAWVGLHTTHPTAEYVTYAGRYNRAQPARPTHLADGTLTQALEAMTRIHRKPYLQEKVLYPVSRFLAMMDTPFRHVHEVMSPLVTGLEYYSTRERTNLAQTIRNIGNRLGVKEDVNKEMASKFCEWRNNYHSHQNDGSRPEHLVIQGGVINYAYLTLCGQAMLDAGYTSPAKVLAAWHPEITSFLNAD